MPQRVTPKCRRGTALARVVYHPVGSLSDPGTAGGLLTPQTVVLGVALVLAGCASQRNVLPTPLDQRRLGATDEYGPGIIGAAPGGLQFKLSKPAHIIVLRVTSEKIERVRPRRSRDERIVAGGAYGISVNVPAPARRRLAAESWQTQNRERDVCPSLLWAAAARDTSGRLVNSPTAAMREYVRCVEGASARTDWDRAVHRVRTAPLSSAPDTNGYWLLIVSDVPITARDIDEQLQSAALWTVPPSTMVQVLPGAIVGTRTSGWAAYAVPLH